MVGMHVTLVLVIVAAAYGFDVKKLTAENKHNLGIYDGSSTTIQKHPYMADLYVKDTPFCTATIVSDSWVITAAYCALYADTTSTILTASTDGSSGKFYPVQKVVIHPKYNPDTNQLDYQYGLIQIKGKFKWSSKTKPIKLAKRNPKANTKVVVCGYGESNSDGSLLQGTMKWQSTKACKSAVSSLGIIYTPRMACAYDKGKVTLCPGDAGDPFVVKNVLYGLAVTVVGTVCSSEAGPSIMADVAAVAPWIKKVSGAKYEDE
ncbi:hypothetical protein J6590_078608 [Homalodisca vitripennis]|nr:hypothetical protein J6590_078608 [Homalodisca vitripennis]